MAELRSGLLCVCLLLCGAAVGRVSAQDTLFLGTDTVRIGSLEWDLFKDHRSRKDLIFSRPDLFPDTVWIFQSFHKAHTVEQTCFGYRDSSGAFVPHGPARYYYPDGSWLGFRYYRNGRLEGAAQDFYPDGHTLVECVFEGGELNGLRRHFHQNGFKESECLYLNGKAEGPEYRWYDNGLIKEIRHFREGMLTGMDSFYYETGRLMSVVPYENGKEQGTAVHYHRNGTVAWQAEWRAGRMVSVHDLRSPLGSPLEPGSFDQGNGWFHYYDENGILTAKELYEDGLVVRMRRVRKKINKL